MTGWRVAVQRVGTIAFGVMLAAAIGEGALRSMRAHLGPKLGAFISNCYDADDAVNGIFYMDPRLGLLLPRPGFETVCSWSGYTWRHRGDRRGFRNPSTSEFTEVALLGDSIVYGHGVEEDDTIAALLRRQMGVDVVNLGITGASFAHYVAMARNYALPLRAKALVVVVFANDMLEIPLQRSAEDLARFNDGLPVRELEVLPSDSLAAFAPQPGFLLRLVRKSVFVRTVQFGVTELLSRGVAKADTLRPSGTSGLERSFGAAVPYARRALRVLSSDAKRAQARLLVLYVPGTLGHFETENQGFPVLLSTLAGEEGFDFIDTTPALMDGPSLEKPGTRLIGDGHLSGAGASIVANLIASRLRDESAMTAPLAQYLSIASAFVRLRDFWDVEHDEKGAFAWTRAASTLEIMGLRPEASVRVELSVRHVGPRRLLTVTSPTGDRDEVMVSSDVSFPLVHVIRVDAQGSLKVRLTIDPFRPSDDGRSRDHRELGVALSAVRITEAGAL